MKTTYWLLSLTCLLVGCIDDPTIYTDEEAISAPDAGEDGGIATSPSAAPRTANIGGGGDCPPDQAEGGRCQDGGGGGGGAEPDASFCELYPSWCPPRPRDPLPPRTPCSLLDPCPPTPVAAPGKETANKAAADVPVENVGGGECLPEEAERGTCTGGGGGTGGGN
jgi:hypothetical protein